MSFTGSDDSFENASSDVPHVSAAGINHLWAKVRKHKLQQPPKEGQSRSPQPCSAQCETRSGPSCGSPQPDSLATSSSIYVPSSQGELIGVESDPLVPSTAEIQRVFAAGKTAWEDLLHEAQSLSSASLSKLYSDPSIMLKDVPALPSTLPLSTILTGRPVWRFDEGINGAVEEKIGLTKYFMLSCTEWTKIRMFKEHPKSHTTPADATRGLWLVTICWAYVLSMRLLEKQRRRVCYTKFRLRPQVSKSLNRTSGSVVLDLGKTASPKLVRWLCALLAPGQGWGVVDESGVPPWAVHCMPGDVHFAIITESFSVAAREQPPDHGEAIGLLQELCQILGLDSERCGRAFDFIPPLSAGFIAALALPLCCIEDLEPQLCVASLTPVQVSIRAPVDMSFITADLDYYMTMSMHPRSVTSVMWSVFWHPEVDCNLVSPWLFSILNVLRPSLETKNAEMLAKIFALRRPRVALWWCGVFLLGSTDIFDRIARYLRSLEERYGYGSGSPPDITVAAWTGVSQSFWEEPISPGLAEAAAVPRADLLRLRKHFMPRNDDCQMFSWKPFGSVRRRIIEPELLPLLENPTSRQYGYWTWLTQDQVGNEVRHDEQGFRRDTGRFVPDVPDNFSLPRAQPISSIGWICLAPSKRATWKMLNQSAGDVTGDRHLDNIDIPAIESHPWLAGWRG